MSRISRTGAWSRSAGRPVDAAHRDDMAERAVAALLESGSREWMSATGDTLVIAWDHGDGFVEVFDCQIRRTRNARVKL